MFSSVSQTSRLLITLENALAIDLLLGNTCSKKHDIHLITYKSGKAAMQIDLILFHRTISVGPCANLRQFSHRCKSEEVAVQHQLLVCDTRIDVLPKSKRKFTPRLKVWKLKGPHKQLFPGLQLPCECICRCS